MYRMLEDLLNQATSGGTESAAPRYGGAAGSSGSLVTIQPPRASAGPVASAPLSSASPTYHSGTDYWSQDRPSYQAKDVGDAFQTYLGRKFDPAGGNPWANDPRFFQNIYNSEEAFNYRNRNAQQPPPGGGGNPQSIISQYQRSHNPAEGLDGLIAELRRNGIDASPYMYGSTPSGNEITLNGQKYKVKTGNNAAWWDPSMGEPGGGGGREFTDPWGGQMEQLTQAYIQSLQNDPARNALAKYIEGLTKGQAQAQQRAQALATDLQGRAKDLRSNPVYSDQQTEAMRVRATEQLQRRRQATLANEREKLYARGFAPTSGLVTGAERTVNSDYNQMEGEINSALAVDAARAQAEQQRYADQLVQIAAQALSGGDATALGMRAQLADLENQQNMDDLARQREAIAATAGPLNLINQRMSSAGGVLAGSNPAQASNSLLGLLNYMQQGDAYARDNRNAQFGGLAQILDLLGYGF